jgi:hypothetical protein
MFGVAAQLCAAVMFFRLRGLTHAQDRVTRQA